MEPSGKAARAAVSSRSIAFGSVFGTIVSALMADQFNPVRVVASTANTLRGGCHRAQCRTEITVTALEVASPAHLPEREIIPRLHVIARETGEQRAGFVLR